MRAMHMGVFPDDLKSKKIDQKTLRRAWAFSAPYRRQLSAYIVAIVVVSIFGVVPPLVTRQIIDKAIPSNDRAAITSWVILLVVVAILASGLSALIRWLGAVIGEGVIATTRKALYDHVQRMPIAFFTRTQTGSLMSRLNNDVVGAQSAFTFVLRSAVSNVLSVVVTMAAMLTLSWKFTLASLIVVPFLIVLSKRVGKVQEKAAREAMGRNAAMNTVMTERFNVAGALLVKLFGRPREEREAFARSADRVAAIGVRRAVTGIVFDIALSLVGALLTASLYWWGANQVLDGKITVGTLVAMSILAQRIYGPLTDLASARIDFVTAFVSFERIFEVLDAPVSIADRPGAVTLPPAAAASGARVEFDNVWFRYPAASEVSVASLESGGPTLSSDESAWVIQGISAVCEPGTLTAIVGPSGAGKTTISALVPRLDGRRCRSSRPRRRTRRHRRFTPGCHRRRQPGRPPVPRHDRRKPSLRPTGSHRCRPRRGLPGGSHPRDDFVFTRGLFHDGRRTRVPALRWREGTSRAGAGVATRPSTGDSRRGHGAPRLRDRSAHPRCPC